MSTKTAAVTIPFDPFNRTYMIVRSTNWHPTPRFRHLLKGIGGVVEEGEDAMGCALREMDEEQPGWFTHIPGAGDSWGEAETRVRAQNGITFVADVDGKDGWVWTVFTAPTDIGIVSFRRARALATESTPEVWTLGVIPPEDQCLPGFRDCIIAMHKMVSAAYPSLRLWADDAS